MRTAAQMLPSFNAEMTNRAKLLVSNHFDLRLIVDPDPISWIIKANSCCNLRLKNLHPFFMMREKLFRLPLLFGGSTV